MPEVRFIIVNRAGNKIPDSGYHNNQRSAEKTSMLHAPCWIIKQMKESPGAKWEFLCDVGYRNEQGQWFTVNEAGYPYLNLMQSQPAAQTFTTRDLAKLMQLLQETREEAHSLHRKMGHAHAAEWSTNDSRLGQLKFHLREAANLLAQIHSSLN